MLSNVALFLAFLHGFSCQLLGLNLPDLGLNLPLNGKNATTTVRTPQACQPSTSIYSNGEHPCKGRLIFEDNFDDRFVNKKKWTIEQYIASSPDYEFVSYQNSEQTVFIRDGSLYLRPAALRNEEDVRGILDLRDGCTRKSEHCYYEQKSVYLLPPVKSAKIASKFSFTYGKIEVKAKMPTGDWIYPLLELVPTLSSKEGIKMWIGYVRGNDHFLSPDGDAGSRLLFGGPVLGTTPSERNYALSNRTTAVPYSKSMHTYTLLWEPEQITLSVDNEVYGIVYINEDDRRFTPFHDEFRLTFGVGVGGINDFPDNYVSNRPKPWANMDRKQLKDFFDARNTWLQTWRGDDSALQIDSVKVYAL